MNKKGSNPPPQGPKPTPPPRPPEKDAWKNIPGYGASNSGFYGWTKFEYKSVKSLYTEDMEKLEAQLNDLGFQGWELVLYSNGVFIFKRSMGDE